MKFRNNIFSFIKYGTRPAPKIILGLYVLSYLIASYNHIIPYLQDGVYAYQKMIPEVPLWIDLYWTSLALLDPLAIILLCVDIPAGLVLFLLIIISDVSINFTFVICTFGISEVLNLFQLSQLGFMIFFLVTYRFVLEETGKSLMREK